MTKNLHIIATPLTGVGLHGGFRGNQWFKHRLNIFKNYTLKSLLNQSNRDFIHWFWLRPEEESNHLVHELADYLAKLNYPFLFTFQGLMYHDDKFTDYDLKTKARNFMMMVRDHLAQKESINLKSLWRHTWENKNKTLPDRLKKGVQVLKETIGNNYEWVYLTRIDSDDMLHKEAINLIQSESPDANKALVFKQGYILNIETGQLAEWNPPTNPPFHTIIFPGSTFFDSQAHLEYYKDFKSHEDVTRVFHCHTLDIGQYMVSYHGKHISTAWESPTLKKMYHKVKYGSTDPFKGNEIEPRPYLYSVSGKNISTRWQSRKTKVRNSMIGKECQDQKIKKKLLQDFGISV